MSVQYLVEKRTNSVNNFSRNQSLKYNAPILRRRMTSLVVTPAKKGVMDNNGVGCMVPLFRADGGAP